LSEGPTYVLIEGDKSAFRFLARLFDAHALADDCGFQIGPKCAGKARFNLWAVAVQRNSLPLRANRSSIHRLQCTKRAFRNAARPSDTE
jgi:hypothetical protein